VDILCSDVGGRAVRRHVVEVWADFGTMIWRGRLVIRSRCFFPRFLHICYAPTQVLDFFLPMENR
jgi:hypothetical protein